MCHTRFFMALCILGYSARLWPGCEWRIFQLPKWRSWLGESCLSHHLLTKFRTGQSEPWLILSDQSQDNRTGDNCLSHHLLSKFRNGRWELWLYLISHRTTEQATSCLSHHLLTNWSIRTLTLSDQPRDNRIGDVPTRRHPPWHQSWQRYYRKCSVSGPGYWRMRWRGSFHGLDDFVRHACSWSFLRRDTGDRRTEYTRRLKRSSGAVWKSRWPSWAPCSKQSLWPLWTQSSIRSRRLKERGTIPNATLSPLDWICIKSSFFYVSIIVRGKVS